MQKGAENTTKNETKPAAEHDSTEVSAYPLVNRKEHNQPGATDVRQLKEVIGKSKQLQEKNTMQQLADTSQKPFPAITIQKKQVASAIPGSGNSIVQRKSSLPPVIKAGAESYSGMAMEDVNVFYNSEKPAQLNAHAFAAGSEIHIAPGQEKHIGHEAWHVVQQKQGRVKPDTTINGAGINTQQTLESEADDMGGKIAQFKMTEAGAHLPVFSPAIAGFAVQRVIAGMEGIARWQDIEDGWVDAYIADITHQFSHLYDGDIVSYLDANAAGWRDEVAMEHNGNHWDLVITKADGRQINVSTRADGNCGVYAIHAVINRAAINANKQFHESPGAFVNTVRTWVQANNPGRDEIRQRIFQEIRNQDNSAETGFGPALTTIVSEIELRALTGTGGSGGSGGSGASAIGGGHRFGVIEQFESELVITDEFEREEYPVPADQLGMVRPGMFVSYEIDKSGNPRITADRTDYTIADRIRIIMLRLGVMANERFAEINIKPKSEKEIAAADIILSFCVEFEGIAQDLRSIGVRETIASTVFMPEVWSACYSTAQKLFAMLRAGGMDDQYMTAQIPKAAFGIADAGHEAETKERHEKTGNILQALMKDMAGAKSPRIYNCGYGIHGFGFILRNGFVELLQSFANGLEYQLPAITVAESIMLNKKFTISQMMELLAMLGGPDKQRAAAQQELFATTIETASNPFPLCNVYWEGANLKSQGEIDRALIQRISKNMIIMQQMLNVMNRRLARMKEVVKILSRG